METFKKYKYYLKELDYPNINAFNEDQIIDIFSSYNRSYLLSWIMKKLNPETIDIETAKVSETVIREYFCKQGLCKASQKLFVEDNNKIKEQVKFFDRTFEYLIQLKSSESIIDSEHVVQFENFTNFLRQDINLFPSFGPISKYTAEKRENILSSSKQQIDNLNKKISTDVNDVIVNMDFTDPIFECSDTKEKENLKKLCTTLCGAVSIIKEKCKEDIEDTTLNLKESVVNDLGKCCKEMGSILQYFKSINLSYEIQEEADAILRPKDNKDFTPTLKQFAESFCTTAKLL